MENKYIIDSYGDVLGVEGEETFKSHYYHFDNRPFHVLVTSEPKDSNGEKYHNFYIITDIFKQEPLNNLDIQEPSEIIENMTEKELLRLMEERAISFYLWYKYDRSYSIDSEEIPQ
jgi:hypothetical protein